jgi:hypothetical protein
VVATSPRALALPVFGPPEDQALSSGDYQPARKGYMPRSYAAQSATYAEQLSLYLQSQFLPSILPTTEECVLLPLFLSVSSTLLVKQSVTGSTIGMRQKNRRASTSKPLSRK